MAHGSGRYPPASERRKDDCKRLKGCFLDAKAGIWPSTSQVCHIRSKAALMLSINEGGALTMAQVTSSELPCTKSCKRNVAGGAFVGEQEVCSRLLSDGKGLILRFTDLCITQLYAEDE